MSLSSLLMASGANEEARRENEALTSELEAAQREHKKLRQVVEQLSRDYQAAKDLDPLRRYQRLKVSQGVLSQHPRHRQLPTPAGERLPPARCAHLHTLHRRGLVRFRQSCR